MTIRVLLADDQRLMREGLRTLLEHEPDLDIVGLAADGKEAADMAKRLRPDVILMDIRMPQLDGISATTAILAATPNVKVLMLTTFDDLADVSRALRAGAVGYLLKDMPAEALSSAIRTAMQGGAVLPPDLMRTFARVNLGESGASGASGSGAEPARTPEGGFAGAGRGVGRGNGMGGMEPLTDRETDVLACLARGMSNREIAGKLCVTEGTVKNHVSSLIAKLGLRDRTQVALFAVRRGFSIGEDEV